MIQSVLITGSGRGIGASTAKLFAARGYAVCVNYVSNRSAADKVVAEIRNSGGRCFSHQADVTKASQVHGLFEAVDCEFGNLSVLVNNVGILRQQARFETISMERFAEVLHTNVMSCVMCSQHAIARMSTEAGGHGGSIVNVSSGASKTGSPNEYIDYAASKGAMDTMTKGLAVELAPLGIRVNGVRPALIYTDIHQSGGELERVDRLKDIIPLRRGGQPSEVAEAIYWLASEASSYVTGSFIDVTGGL